MLGVLTVEVFAVAAFEWAKDVLGDSSLFPRSQDARALIECIQQDEVPHVQYLGTALAELRSRTLIGADGSSTHGRHVIERARDMIVDFQTGPRHRANCAFRMEVIERSLTDHPRRPMILEELRALGPVPATA
ncbi:MAG: hypothetical protein ACE5I7_16055 [Candidatus Binatia bacterium]